MLLKILRGFGWKDELVRERVRDYNYTQFGELMISMTSRYVINVRHFAHAQSA